MKKATYKTLARRSPETIVKDKGSKFIARAFPIDSEKDAEQMIHVLWQKHPKASHICWAWQLGKRYQQYRANDDGEPTHSAGTPIYNQLCAFHLTNVLVAVIRYYGGVNLGVGGLKQAYKKAAETCLTDAKIVTRPIIGLLRLHFQYDNLGTVMRIIDEENLKITDQVMQLDCTLVLSVPEDEIPQKKKTI